VKWFVEVEQVFDVNAGCPCVWSGDDVVDKALDGNWVRGRTSFFTVILIYARLGPTKGSQVRPRKARLCNSFPPRQYSVAHHLEPERRKTSVEEKS
jgi:hypothetical protein